MDIDNPTDAINPTSAVEVEQSLLQQFSCMGTTDRDELVYQLQRLLGKDINYSTAAFFLDMNNWNLQAAICSYLDVEAPYPLPSMCLISDPSASELKSVEPSTRFLETWHISNNGSETWPAGCYAEQCCKTASLVNHNRFPVPCLSPGNSYRLVVEFISPPRVAVYQTKWRLCVPDGSYFGDPMWAIVEVVGSDTVSLTEQLSHLRALGASPSQNTSRSNPFNLGQSKEGDETGMC
ncbi:hypothetical protein HHI36_021057 [Cryptolaemus montrouzieri]|uniref:Nbr1 FW domain-containing protein n=1 Tax=Cryptolaemus montrouzieri TaxID=559131 RepID=A0ABD2MVP1_9CUCU